MSSAKLEFHTAVFHLVLILDLANESFNNTSCRRRSKSFSIKNRSLPYAADGAIRNIYMEDFIRPIELTHIISLSKYYSYGLLDLSYKTARGRYGNS